MYIFRCKLVFLLGFLAFSVQAQKFPEHPETVEGRNKGAAVLVHLNFGAHLPGVDMSDRFGQDGSFGGSLEFATGNNFFFGAEGHYFFGGKVKEDPLAILRTPEGDLIGNNQLVADVLLRERGYYFGGALGKLFTFGAKRSGIRLTLGAGWLQHKIRLQDNSQSVGQIAGEYAKGYDRLSGGFALNQFLGWQHLGANRRSNWCVGLEFNQGFTKSLRDWDFTEMRKLDGRRRDLRFGIRVGWTLPFYLSGADKIYY